ncbi:MAG: glycosyltransferase family A protein [Chloroflexota bacterium]
MISVIIPTYNRRRLLERTLAGVLAQTEKDYEVIVADDGSTDDTFEYLQSQCVLAIHLSHSGKPAIARNSGIAYAQGEFVAFLDSDDAWETTALEELAAALASAPDAGFAFGDYAPAPALPQAAQHGPDGGVAIDIFESLLMTDFLATGSLLIRREAIETVGEFDARLWVADDWDYWLRLAAQFKAVHVSKPLVHIHAVPDGISRASGGTIFADNKLISQKMAAWCLTHRPAAWPLARRVRRRSLYESARYQWHHGRYAQMARDLITLLGP